MKQKETQIGPYEIKAKIGQGGTSVVYRAVDTRNERVVALKVLTPLFATDPKFLRRFINEGKNVKRLDHPNIVQVYDANEADGRQYIAMELVEGGSLSELIKNRNTLLPTDEALNIIEQIAAALDYAHGLGILHRDIKLSNVLLTQDDRALLTDFGSAKHMYGEHTVVTQSGFSVGTPTFMSPEQAKGDPDIDRRTDVYSLGVAAYAILVGRLPFKADSQVALLHKIIYDPPPLPELVNPDIAPGIAYALKRVLSKDPPMRYSTAGEFAAALIEGKSWVPGTQDYTNIPTFPHGTGTFFVPQEHQKKQRRWASLIPLMLMSGLAALALAFGLLAWFGDGFTNIIFADPTKVPDVASPGEAPALDEITIPGPIVLSQFSDDDGTFTLNVPDNWLTSTIEDTINFDSPDIFARLFIQRMDGSAPDEPPSEIVERFLDSEGETYRDIEVLEDTPTELGDVAAHQKNLSASWLGTDVSIRLVGLQSQGQGYVIGSIGDSDYDELLDKVHSSVADSFSTNPEAVALATIEPSATASLFEGISATLTAISETVTSEAEAGFEDVPNATPENGLARTTPSSAPSNIIATPTPNNTGEGQATDASGQATTTRTATATATAVTMVGETSVAGVNLPTTPSDAGIGATTTPREGTGSDAESSTPSSEGTSTPTSTPTQTVTNTPLTSTSTPTETAVPDDTATATRTETSVPIAIATVTATSTATATATKTSTRTPTSTATRTATSTATRTQTSVPPPTRTNTRVPTQTPTATPTPTNTATSTASATSTSSPSPTATAAVVPATITATSTVTKTPFPTPTETTVPTVTPIPTLTSTNTPQPATPIPNSAAPVSGAVIQPVAPETNSGGGGRVNFEWSSNFAPRVGQGYELVFWRPGQSPIANSFGLAAPTTGTNVSVDLESLDNTLGELLDPGEYQWGVLLVQSQPYRRVQYLGGGWQFKYVRGRSSSGSSSPSSGE